MGYRAGISRSVRRGKFDSRSHINRNGNLSGLSPRRLDRSRVGWRLFHSAGHVDRDDIKLGICPIWDNALGKRHSLRHHASGDGDHRSSIMGIGNEGGEELADWRHRALRGGSLHARHKHPHHSSVRGFDRNDRRKFFENKKYSHCWNFIAALLD